MRACATTYVALVLSLPRVSSTVDVDDADQIGDFVRTDLGSGDDAQTNPLLLLHNLVTIGAGADCANPTPNEQACITQLGKSQGRWLWGRERYSKRRQTHATSTEPVICRGQKLRLFARLIATCTLH